MRYILSVRSRPVLEKFASGNVLLAFDFDGTLAPITSEPDRAVMRASTRKLLHTLALKYPCIVASGRCRADIRRRLRGIGLLEVVGNHGIEPWDSSPALAQTVKEWIPILKQRLKLLPGVMIENKQFSISVHYRKARRKKIAIKAIKQVARTLPGARLIGGKQVINCVLRDAPDKGHAVETARQKRHCDHVIYVGDDETDETVFARAQRGHVLGIRVGAKRSSRARFYIRNQREIDRLVSTLIGLRARGA
jgi:trehalose 6-phosphate phosphatase